MQLGSELRLANLGEPAQPEHSWHNISSSSLLLACFTRLCTELSLVFKVHEFGLSATAKHQIGPSDSGSSVESLLFHTRTGCQHLGRMFNLLLFSGLSKKYLSFC